MPSEGAAISALQRGLQVVAKEWRDSGYRHRQIEEMIAAAENATWGVSDDGLDWSRVSGSASSNVRIVLLRGDPAPSTNLNPSATWQTWPELWGDSVPTVYVRPVSYTPLWSGMVLCHEMDHALEYADGTCTPGEPQADWDSAEARAHIREAVVLDAVTRGEFIAAVGGSSVEDLLARDAVGLGSELGTTIPARLRQAVRSDSEMLHRRGSLVMSAVMVAAVGPQHVFDHPPADQGPVYRRAWSAWDSESA